MPFARINVSLCILLYIIFVTADPSRGSIVFYADSSCREQVNSAQDVVTGACVNTKGVIAVAAGSLPSCGHTTAILYISDIAGCMDPSFLPIVRSGHVGDCLSFIESRLIDSAHFQCENSTDGTGNTPDNTPDYTTGSPSGNPLPSNEPPDDESGTGRGGLSLGSTLGIVFGLIDGRDIRGIEVRRRLGWGGIRRRDQGSRASLPRTLGFLPGSMMCWHGGKAQVCRGRKGNLCVENLHLRLRNCPLVMLDRLPRQDLSTSQGSLMLFTDECCHDPISESSVPLISGDCQGAPFAGIRGVVLTSLPTCPDYGLPLLIVSNETSCKNPQSESNANSGLIGKCQSFVVNEISSFQFICYGKGVSSVSLPSTTTNWQWQSTPSTTANWQWQSTPSTTASWQWQSTPSTTASWQWQSTTSTTAWAQSETHWKPTSTWGWRGTYGAGPTLTIIPAGKETKDLGADGWPWVTLTITMNDTVYEVRQPAAEYDLVREESRYCNGGDMASRRDGAPPVLVCLVTIWLLISLL
ncbi:hypothetical protein GQX73_g4145 [Xylaria multiplex]|uniref:Uncharacterized protein n=1 Tax=Xylaria multiplex TaxID=323545 RepID=A0A7C8IYJ7_9PEZI|nr:hypothetical protein GQX73_g4145 [Xylaria multiplex]